MHAWLLGGKDDDDAITSCHRYSQHLVLAATDGEMEAEFKTKTVDDAKIANRPCGVAMQLMSHQDLAQCLGHHVALCMLNFGRNAIMLDLIWRRSD